MPARPFPEFGFGADGPTCAIQTPDRFAQKEQPVTAPSEHDEDREDSDDLRVVRKTAVTPGTEVANLPHAENPVDEASEDSFPASDPPAYSGRREPEDDPNEFAKESPSP